MVISRVPRLNIRPKHLVKVYSFNIGTPIPLVRTADDFEKVKPLIKNLDNFQLIGTIQSIRITSTRGTGFYRVLNYEQLGKIKETYPHLPTYTASVTNVVFYKSHLLNAFRATDQGDVFTTSPNNDTSIVPTFNIYNQIAPLLIKIDMLEPGDKEFTEDNQKVKSLILWDCWFKESTIEFKVETDLFMTQESEITFAWILPQS